VESASLFGVPRERSLMAGAALECIHCYSLVHDDLPAIDNEDLRIRTQHSLTFDIASRVETHPDPAIRAALVIALARASGLGGMAGGQMLDLAAEGRFSGDGPPALDASEIALLQSMKTGAL